MKKHMKFSEGGRELLIRLEGLSYAKYIDSAGHPTIGIGHKLTEEELFNGVVVLDGMGVDFATHGLNMWHVYKLLDKDLVRFVAAVNEYVSVELNQNQFDALVSFAYNIGVSAFKNSTLLKRVNDGKFEEVFIEFRKWVHAGGKRNDGLVNRREREIDLWDKVV